jgi:hypothetical protein
MWIRVICFRKRPSKIIAGWITVAGYKQIHGSVAIDVCSSDLAELPILRTAPFITQILFANASQYAA